MKRIFRSFHSYDYFMLMMCVLLGEQLVFNSGIVSSSIHASFEYYIDSLIPSLFCFLVLTAFISSSRLKHLFSFLMLPMCKLLCLPWNCGSILFLSLIGGYPAGIKALSDAWKQKEIDEATVKRVVLFAVCPAPSFVIVTIGCQLFHHIQTGILLYVTQLISTLFVAFALSIRQSVPSTKSLTCSMFETTGLSYSEALVEAVVFSAQTMLVMGGYILLFGVLRSFIAQIGFSGQLFALLSALLEISVGTAELIKFPSKYLLQILSFCLSFGSLSIQFQLKSNLKDCPCSLLRVMMGRLIHGIFSATVITVLIPLFPQAKAVFSADSFAIPQSQSSTPLLSICLVGMMIIIIFTKKVNPRLTSK